LVDMVEMVEVRMPMHQKIHDQDAMDE